MKVFSIKTKFPGTHGALIVVPAIRAVHLTAAQRNIEWLGLEGT